jgi:UDP-glucuronate 4-epimerase
MKICITGIAGFIGFHLALKLKKEGHDVYGYDNFNDFVYSSGFKHERFEILKSAGIYMSKSLEADFVIHLAAHAGVRHSMDNALEYIENNIVETQKLIDQCNTKVIYASTSCTMAGNPLPWKEDDPVTHQLNPYGYTKMCNESQFRSSSLDTVGLRFFTVYGPWGRPDMALWQFTQAISNGIPIELYNHGMMKRDFTYIDDVVSGIETIINNFDDCKNSIYNIGCGSQVSLIDFVKEIEKHFGKAEIIYKERHKADTLETWADNNKLRKLGWEPKVSIQEGVARFAEWYIEQFH